MFRLKCYDCANLVRGSQDEGTIGGGTDNLPARCAARPVVEEAVRSELKYYGNNASPFSTWLCGQTGIDENSISGDVPADDDPVRVYVDDAGEEVAEFRDPAWIAIDAYLATLPRMRISRLRDRRTRQRVTGYIRLPMPNEWMLRRESQIAEDVLWRAHKGRCHEYIRRPDEDDVVLQTHHRCEPIAVEAEEPAPAHQPDPHDAELDAHYDAQWRIIQEAEITEWMASGHWHGHIHPTTRAVPAMAL
ncbi:MAG TPA: hypothetical protein PLF13_14180 [candidate division Zixibacteria bacterium]|nr:hypothetical protein [candidate division Zixibacteria bacterium]